jgi:hypothetical protein
MAEWVRVSTTSAVGSLVWECTATLSGSNLDQASEAQSEGADHRRDSGGMSLTATPGKVEGLRERALGRLPQYLE